MGVDDLVSSMENFGMLDRSSEESREVPGEIVSDVAGVLEFEIGMRDFQFGVFGFGRMGFIPPDPARSFSLAWILAWRCMLPFVVNDILQILH